jgi:shikimate dehydrogenase
MHNAAFAALGLDWRYVKLPVPPELFERTVRALPGSGYAGANVTIPHKHAALSLADSATAAARAIGAANTLTFDDHGAVDADNTDAGGFLAALGESPRGRSALVLGAGGAARAVVVALQSAGCSIRLHARNRAQAEDLAVQTPVEIGPWPPEPGSWDVLVNCTPVGMYPRLDETPLQPALLTGRCVYDLIYNPPATKLMRDAAALGLQTLGGLEMLVGQAREQFEWWTGSKPRPGVMKDAAQRRLAEFTRDENHLVR